MSALALGPAVMFTPADRPERYVKALERADAVILDLEDAVTPDARPAARDAVAAAWAGRATGGVDGGPLDEDRVVEWSHPGGHRWRWEFQDGGDGTCEVTEIFDYSWSRPAMRRALETARIPQANGRGIQASLTRLAGRYL